MRKTARLLSTLGILLAASPFSSASMTLLNGATQSSSPAYSSFLDTATASTIAWDFFGTADHILTGSISGQTVNVEAVTNTGASAAGAGTAPAISAVNSGNGGNPFPWDPHGYSFSNYSGSDLAARNAIANDGMGIYSNGGTLTLAIPNSVVTEGQLYHVEILSIAAASTSRAMDVSANGTLFVDDWTIALSGNYNGVLEFDIPAGVNGISILMGQGAGAADNNPFLSGVSITAVPEPSALASALGGLAILGLVRRRR